MPPDRKMPTGTSAIRCRATLSSTTLPELRLANRRSVPGARDAPVRRAPHRAGGLDRAPLAGTEQLHPRDGGPGPTTNPFQRIDLTARRSRRGCSRRPAARIDRTSDENIRDHVPVRVRVAAQM